MTVSVSRLILAAPSGEGEDQRATESGLMPATTQTRLTMRDSDARLLDRMADLYGSMKRKLYALIAAHGGKAQLRKTASAVSMASARACSMRWPSSCRISSTAHASCSSKSPEIHGKR